jgi:hypothetical protein
MWGRITVHLRAARKPAIQMGLRYVPYFWNVYNKLYKNPYDSSDIKSLDADELALQH